ncbi:lytic polysaccharide monooxygenase [Peniophora sp. CONT]|nr:lytic polysaccharide monooxygenase [Peniophora sp. CONT]
MFAASVISALIAASAVYAHGNIDEVVVDGTAYTGYLPYQDPYTSPTPDRAERKIPSNSPWKDLATSDIQCNTGGETPAALTVPVSAGSVVNAHWTTWPDSHKGPVLTYLARAPDGTDITAWTPGDDAVWFKIDEAGYTSSDGKWAATDVLINQNSTWPITIPANLKAGQYIMRHEIIALHQAGSYPGAEFYPGCYQLEVTGSGTALPTEGLVSFPGAYTSSDAGIVFNIYTDFDSYPIPGPAVWDGVSSAIGSGSGSSSSAASGASSTAVAATSSAAAVTSSAAATTSSAAGATSAVESFSSSSAATSTASSSSAAATSSAVTATSAATSSTAPTSAVVTSSAVASTSATSTSAAASATTSATVKNANVCMNEYNQCIAASQPSPDWTGCTATKDTCMDGAVYMRVKRSGTLGRRIL